MRVQALIITLLAVTFAHADSNKAPVLPPGLQAEIVELYSKNNCAEILRRTRSDMIPSFRPNVMAIVASCDPPWEDPENIFKEAERREPTGDLIVVLHARYRTIKDPKSADELWKRVLLIARNPAFMAMAKDYFAGNYEQAKKPINLSSTTIFGNVMVGAGQESNPRPDDLVYIPSHGSGALYAHGDLTWRRWYRWGSLALTSDLRVNQYFSQSVFNSQYLDFALPIALHVYEDKDVVIQPIGGHSLINGDDYRSYYGLQLEGVVYKSTYRQAVRGLVFQDIIDIPELSDSDGAHYRFEYSWDFFESLRTYSLLFWVEHVSAGHAEEFNNVEGYFPFSHTSAGTGFKFEQNLGKFNFGVEPALSYRFDSENSVYQNRKTHNQVSVRRTDFIVDVRPYFTIPLARDVQLLTWYSYHRVFSDIGRNDYVDYNQHNHTGALALKVALSTY